LPRIGFMFKSHLRRPVRRTTFTGATPLNTPEHTRQRTGKCIALVDARFLGWLLQPTVQRSGADAVPPAQTVPRALDAALRQAGLDLDVLRVYWYADVQLAAPVNDVVQRTVLDPDNDGGVTLLRAMAADIGQLAQARAVEHLLVVSDDERLLGAVDQAQLCGLSVHMLIDEAGADFARLAQDDPSWARLLAQADRSVVLQSSERGMQVSGPQATVPEEDPQVMEAAILAQLQAWWDEEPENQRIDLHDELQFSRSIPQEVDRQLLLRLSRSLGHPLTWPEKKVMRENVRRLVLGDDYTPFSSKPAEPALD